MVGNIGIRHGFQAISLESENPEMEELNIVRVERLLVNLNKNQGLGFVVGGKVLDKRLLKTIFVTIGGFLSTVLPLILALQSKTKSRDDNEACALLANYRNAIKALMASANATCNYGMTVNDILA